ncbi:MAG: ABC transporter substrate-binding protein, partial [Nitratireductor sp.]
MRALLFSTALLAIGVVSAAADTTQPDPSNWDAVLKDARGETVYFNAWGGSQNINAYIDWAGAELKERYGVTLRHVKLEDTASAVATVVAEKAAGRDMGGTVDLIWINGENFAAMKRQGLILSPGWAEKLPNWAFVDVENKPTVRSDFTVPVEGLESPWGMAKLVFFYDTARIHVEDLPQDADGLLKWAQENPGRFSYPQPPDFIGSSFLKQVLAETVEDPALLQKPVDEDAFDQVTKPLFDYLDALNPVMWRSGRAYPQNYPAM